MKWYDDWDLFQNYMGWVQMGGGKDETRLTKRWQLSKQLTRWGAGFITLLKHCCVCLKVSITHTWILMGEEGYIHKWNRLVVIRNYDAPINALIFTELNDSIFKNRIQKSGYNLSEIFNILFTITSKFLESEDHSSFALLVYVT